MLSNLDLIHFRQKLETRRQVAKEQAELREKRSQIMQVLFRYIPRQEDMMARSKLIDKLADKLVETLYGQTPPE